MPIISCPHCGARRDTPNDKLPSKAVTARCPECRQRFRFSPQSLKAPGPYSEQSLCCPHCGLSREIPRYRHANPRATVDCRRCKRPFRLVQGNAHEMAKPLPAVGLRSIGGLFVDSWELFCQRGWGLLAIYLLTSLVIIAPLLATTLFLTLGKPSPQLFWGGMLAGGLFGLLGGGWMSASIFTHICNPKLGILAALNQGRKQLWAFATLLLLLGLFLTGGALLLILPGILFAVWFCFCHYVLAEEGLRGLQALERSRQLVRGHWWAVFGRFTLLLLIALSISLLTARLPVIGAALNFAFSLLLTPFALIYYYLLYQDLKSCQHPAARTTGNFGLPLATALLGWMLIPGLLFAVNNWNRLPENSISAQSSAVVDQLFNYDQALLLKKAEQAPQRSSFPHPQALSRADYQRLLKMHQLPTPGTGITLGPAILSAEHFWSDDQEPHLWLKLELSDFPNLALSHNRSTRVLIDKVLDTSARDRYNREHSFEHDSFQWVDILTSSPSSASYQGIRNVYLKQGTRPEQIRSISGQLELSLPLGIKTLQLDRNDIGRTLQIAGKALTLENLGADGISLRYQGKRSELLSIRALDRHAEPLQEAGFTWQKIGEAFNLRQMFNGDVDSVTLLIASDSVTHSYPFEISR